MLHYKKTFLLVLLFIILITNLPADSSFYRLYKDYLYMMKLTGKVEQSSLNFHSISTDLLGVESINGLWTDRSYTTDWINSDSMNLSFIPMEVFVTFNSNKAFGMNDGAFWQGKGINTRVMGGLFFENDWLMATLLPEVWASQNSNFSIVSTSSSSGYGDYWTIFDNLQRYGDKAFYQFNLG
ncbi:MAG: hypothetical protein KAR21_15125, partial [Spirochaetales bacterium]|nr:hypothetical protein [Spirochaetales bacterium]